MFSEINRIIDNHLNQNSLDKFSVIIGYNPSKGARSPLLWNKVYKAEKKNMAMLPLDVNSERLCELISCLKENNKCLGGAIAVPHKEAMFNLLENQCAPEIKEIGAINCFFRDAEDNSEFFSGTNTDGEASLEPISKLIKEQKNLNICLIGYGGAGKAVAAFLIKSMKDSQKLKIFNRSEIKKSLKNSKVLFFSSKVLSNYIDTFDLIINATTVGTKENLSESPIPSKLFSKIKSSTLIYDINYDPPKTKLMKLAEKKGLKTINGLRMNLIQAVLGYKYTNNTSFSINEIYNIMRS
ncbi:hypothetical protein OA416_00235 [Paracoccaceae bacterium]|nr:hypothetical protein [Paracoccaceae bacterium]